MCRKAGQVREHDEKRCFRSVLVHTVLQFVGLAPARMSGSDSEIAQAQGPADAAAILPRGYLFRHQTEPLNAGRFDNVDDLSDVIEQEIVVGLQKGSAV